MTRLRVAFLFTAQMLAMTSARATEPTWQSPQDVEFTARCDGSKERYVLMLPRSFQAGKPIDLLVALHGHGSDRWQCVRNGRDECRAMRDAAARHEMLVLSPDYRARTSWMGPKAEADMLQILDDVRQKYAIRYVLVWGGSMGASSALIFAALHPDRVDGLVAINPTANLVAFQSSVPGVHEAIAKSFGGTQAEIPREYERRNAEQHAERFSMPMAATVGGRDRACPPDSTRRLFAALTKAGNQALLIDRPEGGHSTNYADTTAAVDFVVQAVQRRASRREILLPQFCNTPDAMAVLPDGNIILSVPNFTDPTSPGVLMKVSPQNEVSLYAKLPAHPQTGHVYPMGVRQAPSGDLYVADCQYMHQPPAQSRLLCVRVTDGKPGAVEVVASGLSVANGVAIRDGSVYVTDSACGKTADGATTSSIYRFRLNERGVQIQPGRQDPHLLATLTTANRAIPVGADGIDFDDRGNLYVSNCGDGILEKLVLGRSGEVIHHTAFTKAGQMQSADGLFYDPRSQRLYVADILANAIRAVHLDGQVETVAQNGDCDGAGGLLDAPSEVIVRGRELIVANFDRVFPGGVNTKSERRHTLSAISLPTEAGKQESTKGN